MYKSNVILHCFLKQRFPSTICFYEHGNRWAYSIESATKLLKFNVLYPSYISTNWKFLIFFHFSNSPKAFLIILEIVTSSDTCPKSTKKPKQGVSGVGYYIVLPKKFWRQIFSSRLNIIAATEVLRLWTVYATLVSVYCYCSLTTRHYFTYLMLRS